MANAPVVVTGVRGDDSRGSPRVALGGLFKDLNFFLLQRLPMRTHLVGEIEGNGGKVVKLEKQADYVICDHLRSDAPGGSYSYTFILESIKAGELQNPAAHAAGPRPGAVRETGSIVPAKGTRTPFSREDDVELWEWVERAKLNGDSVQGNEIYKKLEAANPRHTYQSWRDRYIKKLMNRPPPPGAQAPLRDTSVSARDQAVEDALATPEFEDENPRKRRKTEHTAGEDRATQQAGEIEITGGGEHSHGAQADVEKLLDEADAIDNLDPEQEDTAWTFWQGANPSRTAQQWRTLWRTVARPLWLKRDQKSSNVELPDHAGLSSSKDPAGSADQHQPRKGSLAPHSADSTALQPSRGKGLDGQARPIFKKPRLQPNTTDAYPERATRLDDSLNGNGIGRSSPGHGRHDVPIVDEEGFTVTKPGRPEARQPRSNHERLISDKIDVPLTPSDAIDAADMQFRREGGFPSKREEDLTTSEDLQKRGTVSNKVAQPSTTSESVAQDAFMHTARSGSPPLPAESRYQPLHGTRKIIEGHGESNISKNATSNGITDTSANDVPASSMQLLSSASRPTVVSSSQLESDAGGDQGQQLPSAVRGAGNALTAANLAAQEAQHRPVERRGFDLPKDDEAKDQTDFADALRRLLGQKPLTGLNDDRSASAMRQNKDLPRSNKIHARTFATESDHHRSPSQTSSQAHLDEVLNSNLNWPSSPQRVEKQSPDNKSQSKARPRQREPQAQESADLQFAEVASQFDSQSLQSQVDFNDILNEDTLLAETKHHDDQGFSSSSAVAQATNGEADSSYANGAAWRHHDRQDQSIDDMDLAIADPYESSLNNIEQGHSPEPEEATLVQALQHEEEEVEIDDEAEDEGRDYDEEEDEKAQPAANEIIDISSTSLPSSQPESSVHSDSFTRPTSARHARTARALQTQDIWNAETQQPDFSMPLPPDSDDEADERSTVPASARHTRDQLRFQLQTDSDFSSPPEARDETGSELELEPETMPLPEFEPGFEPADQNESQPDDPEQLNSWIATMQVKGYKEVDIIYALKRTSTRLDLAELVLIYKKRGKGLPDDVPGIWSEEEDDALESGDARYLEYLEKKHGTWDELQARMKYLQDWREA